MVVVREQVGRLLGQGEGVEFGEDGGGEGGGVVGGPDPLYGCGGPGGVVEEHVFDLAALAVVLQAGRSQLCYKVGSRLEESAGGRGGGMDEVLRIALRPQ